MLRLMHTNESRETVVSPYQLLFMAFFDLTIPLDSVNKQGLCVTFFKFV